MDILKQWKSLTMAGIRGGGQLLSFETEEGLMAVKIAPLDIETLTSGSKEDRLPLRKKYFNIAQLMKRLKDDYSIEIGNACDYNSSFAESNSLWIKNTESEILAKDGFNLMNYYADITSERYEFGVHTELVSILDQYGYYGEWFSPGVLILTED